MFKLAQNIMQKMDSGLAAFKKFQPIGQTVPQVAKAPQAISTAVNTSKNTLLCTA